MRRKARQTLSEQASSQEGPNCENFRLPNLSLFINQCMVAATPETARRSTRLQPSTPMHMRTRAASRTASTAPSDSRNASSVGSNKSNAGRKRRASSPGATEVIGGEERPAKRSRSNAPTENVIVSPPRARAAKRKPAGLYEEKDTDPDEEEMFESDRPHSSSTSHDAKSESQPDELANPPPMNGDAHEDFDDRKDSFNDGEAIAEVDGDPAKPPSPTEQVMSNNATPIATPVPGSPASGAMGLKPRGRGRWGRQRVPKEPKPSVEPSEKNKKRLPGRRRAPNPNDSIEADMRRQLQLRMAYRAVVKHLKPILQEIANRTEEKIDMDPEYHKTCEQYEIVNSQLDERLQRRLHDVDMEEEVIVGHARDMCQKESELVRTQYKVRLHVLGSVLCKLRVNIGKN